jgi:competence protein ComEC
MMGKVKPEWVSLSLVLALAGGITLADVLSLALSLWISLFLLSLLGLFFFRSRSRIALVVCLVLAALSLGAGRLQLEAERCEALPTCTTLYSMYRARARSRKLTLYAARTAQYLYE